MFESTALLSMVNGGMKYMPDITGFERCTWEAGSSGLMPGSAERWVEKALELEKKLKEETLENSELDDSGSRGPGGPSQGLITKPGTPDFDGRGPAGPVPRAAGNPGGVPIVPRY